MIKNLRLAILISLLPALSPLFSQPCDCLNTGNCPVPIEDNGTFYGTLDVTVSGANDLASCPLTQVCFSITHTWVGDLSVTLTSPGGLNYLLMADSNNGPGGCGTDADNVDVCITTGTGNPLTNNTEYMCNPGPCFSGNCCLTGFWTVPCGGVSDPFSGAQQAPNCDLNDFNLPGQPANGTWTLAVNDVCQQDVGTLNNFSLTFACGTQSCIVCSADGGMLPGQSVASCFGDPSLALNLSPIYSGPPPSPGEYGYAYVISQNGVITSINPTADMSFQPPGVYSVCGISYVLTAIGDVQSLVGMNLTTAQNLLSGATAPFCADFSDNCINVTIGPAIPPSFFDTLVCLGDCIDYGGQILCGSGSVTFQSWLGCDSVVNVVMIPIPPIFSEQNVTVCQGDCITINNQTYCPPGPHVFTVENWQGCDSTITLTFDQILTTAIILPLNPPPLSCANPVTTLDAFSSIPALGPGVIYSWSGPNNFSSTDPVIGVSTPGVYNLMVTNNSVTPACVSTASVTITGNQNGPNLQLNSQPPPICVGASFNLATLNVVDLNNTNPTITFHSATPATPANQLPNTTVSPTTTTTYYILGTTGNCTDEIPVTVTVNPVPTADFTVTSPICIDSAATVTYTGTAGSGATFNWNFGGGTATPGTGPGPHTVEWASGGTKTITLVVTQNGCTSASVSQTVAVNSQIPAPVVNCQPMTSSITFTWSPIPGATGYNVTPAVGPSGTMLNDTTYQVTGLDPGEQVSIFVEAISGNACPGSSTQITCTAQDCPPVTVSIAPVADICLDGTAGPIQLVASQTGGMGGGVYSWSGPGVNPITGMFNPANANPGANNIVVTYEEGTCLYNATRVINVFPQPSANFSVTSPICVSGTSTVNYTGNASNNAIFTWDFAGGTATPGTGPGPHSVSWPDGGSYMISLMVEEDGCGSDTVTQTVTVENQLPAPIIDCVTTTATVEFFWNQIPGAGGYDVVVVSGNGTGTATSDTSMLFTGLTPGDDVTIQVTVLNPGACGNSSAQETCIAQDCPPVTIVIDPVSTICLDATAMPFDLTATVSGAAGGGMLTWSGPGITDPATGTFDPNMANIGANQITATYEESSCLFTQGITINVRAQPVASFTVETPVCENESATVSYTGTVQSGITFAWDFGGGTAVPGGTSQGPHNVTWPDAGPHDISLTVTNASGCVSEIFSETVQVDEPIVAPAITCVTTTSTVQFNWPDVPGVTDLDITVVTGQSGTQPTPNSFLVENLVPDDQVTISMQLSNNGACPPVMVQQTCVAKECPAIVVDVQPVSPICIGAATPVQLTADVTGSDGTGSGVWSGPGVSNGNFDATAAGVGQHVVTYTFEEVNCIYEDSTTVVVFSEPTADFTATAVICVADAGTVTYTGNASANAAYTWDFDGGTATPGTGPGPHQVTWPAPGNYQISLTVAQDGCASTEFTQNVQVDAELTAPVVNCNSTTESVEFVWNQVPGATDYAVQVLAGQTGTQTSDTSYFVSGLVPGDEVTLELIVTGPTVCPAIVIQEACTAMDCPTVTIDIAPVGPICLTAQTAVIDLEANVTGGGASGTGTWSGNGIADPAAGVFDPAIAGPGNHTVTFNYVENNCPFSDAIQIQVSPPPVADAGPDATITCKEDQTEAELGGAGSSAGPDISYLWSAAGGPFPGDSTILNPVVTEPGTYTLTVINTALGCETTDVVVVDASQDIPVPDISLTPISCFGENDGAISIVSVTGGVEPYLFSLNGSTFSDITTFQPLTPDVYELVVMDAAGCENMLTLNIPQPQEVHVDLIVYIEGGNVLHLGDSAQLAALMTIPLDSVDVINWEPDSLLSCNGCPNPVAYPVQTTTFSVTVESNGCSDSDQATIFVRKDRVVFVPNAFSPNNDGINDIFMVFAGPQVARVKSFLVFDRWGETVFQYYDFPPNEPAYGWDGTYRNKKFNPAVFTWFAEIEFVDGATDIFEGDVSLMR